MSEHESKLLEKKFRRKLRLRTYIIITLSCFLLLLAGSLVFWHYSHLFQARQVLISAKTVRLSAKAVSYDYYGNGQTMTERSTRNGLRDDAEKEILKMADCKGDIQYIEFDANHMEVTELIYTEDDYAARFCLEGKESVWTVYRLDKIVDY